MSRTYRNHVKYLPPTTEQVESREQKRRRDERRLARLAELDALKEYQELMARMRARDLDYAMQ